MDHVPRPNRSPLSFPRIACICAKTDLCGLVEIRKPEDFPFSKQTFQDADLGVELIPVSETAAFLQAWLWFGLIEDIFNIVGVVVQTRDFVVHDNLYGLCLDTTILHRYLWYWVAADMTNLSVERRHQHHTAINECLDVAYQALKMYTRLPDDKVFEGSGHLYLSDDQNNTLLAISILGETLDLARSAIYHRQDPRDWRRTWELTLTARTWFIDAGWCISEIAAIAKRQTVAFLHTSLFLSRLDRSTLSMNHGLCTIDKCLLLDIDHGTYQTRHTVEGCTCPRITLAYSEYLRMDRLLCKGRYPVITYSRLDSMTRRIVVHEPETIRGTLQYVAISHVWSDGLGNLQENSLPACQLSRIQEQVNSLYPRRSSDIPFWIDTICVPREPTTRSFAIQSMRKVYAQAKSILVFDSILDLFQSTDPPEHLFLVIKILPWSTRLWTWHESALARYVYFQLQDSAIMGDKLHNRYHQQPPKSHTAIFIQDLFNDCDGPNKTLSETLIRTMGLSSFEANRNTVWDIVQSRGINQDSDETAGSQQREIELALEKRIKAPWEETDSSDDLEHEDEIEQPMICAASVPDLPTNDSDNVEIPRADAASDNKMRHGEHQRNEDGAPLTAKNAQLREELVSLKREHDTLMTEASVLKMENRILRDENRKLSKQNGILLDENKILRKGNRDLRQGIKELRLHYRKLSRVVGQSIGPWKDDARHEEIEMDDGERRYKFKQIAPAGSRPSIPAQWIAQACLSTSDNVLRQQIRGIIGHSGSFPYWLRGFDPVFMECFAFYKNVTRVATLRADFKEMMAQQIDQVTSAISLRTTSWVGDEAICLAIILNLDVLTIERTPRQERMEVLARMWYYVPRSFLFLPIPHLATNGLRWMPKSFLRTGGHGQNISPFITALRSDKGLAFSGSEGAFLCIDRPFSSNHVIKFDYGDRSYRIKASPHEIGPWDLSQWHLAVLFDDTPHKDDKIRAVLVSLTKQTGKVVFTRYKLSVYVYSDDWPALGRRNSTIYAVNVEPASEDVTWVVG